MGDKKQVGEGAAERLSKTFSRQKQKDGTAAYVTSNEHKPTHSERKQYTGKNYESTKWRGTRLHKDPRGSDEIDFRRHTETHGPFVR